MTSTIVAAYGFLSLFLILYVAYLIFGRLFSIVERRRPIGKNSKKLKKYERMTKAATDSQGAADDSDFL